MKPIECQGLTKRYGSTLALDGLSLSLPAGEPIALIGPNGAGKTTLLSVLCGFIKPTSGAVSILGEEAGSRGLNGRLSALPQDALLDPRLSVGRQLKFFARLQGMRGPDVKKEVDRVLQLVNLSDSVCAKPSDLSHGMRKRIAIAQALLGSPELVLLDEPTAGIDPPNAKMIRDLVRDQSDTTTFIVSSHNLDELERLCGSVVYLEKGRLISAGPLSEDTDDDYITLRMGTVVESEFIEAASRLPSVSEIVITSGGDFLLKTEDDMATSAALMHLLVEKNWKYRQLSRGKSLEERLYGDVRS